MKVVIAGISLEKADAVGHDILGEYTCLKEAGIEAYIYSPGCTPETKSFVTHDCLKFLQHKDSILILHHSVFWNKISELLAAAKGKKIVKYHNITPEHFFLPYAHNYFKACLLGRRQNMEIVQQGIDLLLACSGYNAGEFVAEGFPEDKCRVLPPFNNMKYLDNVNADIGVLNRLIDDKINVLFVGRMAPNKGHRHIICTAYYYKLLFGKKARFIITGSLDPSLKGYYNELVALVKRLDIKDMVEFTGKASLSELKAYYQGSHVFLLLSEHEGFCVPLIEAQYYNLPVIACESSAIKETAGENQLVFNDKNYEQLAAAVYTLTNSNEIRTYLIDEGKKNFRRFELEALKQKFLDYLRELK